MRGHKGDIDPGRGTTLEVVSGLTIEGEAFALDGKHIIDCTLVNCVLEYSGGEVVLERTQLRGCRHVFYGQARLTLHYLQGVGLMPHVPSEWGEFSDSVH